VFNQDIINFLAMQHFIDVLIEKYRENYEKNVIDI